MLIRTLFLSLLWICSFAVEALLAQDQNARRIQTHYEQGKLAYDLGQFERAEASFSRALAQKEEQIFYEDALYWRLKSRIARDSVHIGALVQQFEGESANRQYIKLAYVDWAEYELAEGGRSEYRRLLERAIELSGLPAEQAQWTMLLAYNESARDSMQAAHALLDLTADRYSGTKWAPEARYQAARWHLQAQQFAEAAEDFKKLRAEDPRHPNSRAIGLRLGESLYKSGQYAEAIEEFKRQLPIHKGEDARRAVYLVAESYNILEDFDNATTWYLRYQREAEQAGMDSRAADYGLGWVYLKQEIYHWAIDAFAKAALGEDELAQKSTYYQAVAEKLSGKYPEALATFEDFFTRFEEGIWAERVAYEWAVTAFEMGDYSKAIQVLLPLARRAAELEDPGPILTFLGEAFFANGEYSSAIEAFDEAAKNASLRPAVRMQAEFQKGWVLYRNQAYADARENFELVYRSPYAGELQAEALFWSADCSYQLEAYDRAAAEFQRFTESFPDHKLSGAAVYSLGWAQFMRGEFEPAAQQLEAFLNSYEAPPIAIFPYDIDTQLRLGDAYFALNRYDEAISYYKKAIGAEPGGDYAMYQIANCYYRAERTADAIDEFAKLLRIYPYTRFREQAQFNIGYLWFLNGRFELAIENYEKLIRMVPKSNWAARAQYNIGDALFNAGKYDSAIVAYKVVLDEYPRSEFVIEAANSIQSAQLATGQTDTSNELLQEFIRKNPRASTLDALRYRKAQSLAQAGDFEKAAEAYEQYYRISTNRQRKDDALFQWAESLRFLERMDEAQLRYKQLIESYPNSEWTPTALSTLAREAFEQTNYEQALGYFRQMESKGTSYREDAWLGQAEVLVADNRLTEAEALYEKVLQQQPNSQPALLGKGVLAFEREEFALTDSLLRPIAERDLSEQGAKALYYLGLTEWTQGQSKQAIQHLSNVNVLFGIYQQWVTKSALKLIEIHLASGQRGAAVDVLNQLKERYPNEAETKQAEALLKQ